MKRWFLPHGLWLLVTLVTFTVGSQLAQQHRSSLELPSSSLERGRGLEIGSTEGGRKGGVQEHSETAGGSAIDQGAQGSEVGVSLMRQHRGENVKGQQKLPPLSKEEIEALVLQSINARDPVVRRQAFDRLLQEMRSEDFTREQAMTMRSTMHHNGANGEQWRLFDYTWGANHPEVAMAHIEEISEKHRRGYLSNMIPGLASADPRLAVELFEGLDGNLQGRLRNRLYEGLIDHDISAATEYVYDSAPERPDWRRMDTFTRELAGEQGIDATLDWAAELPDGSLRSNAWSAAYAKWTSQDPHGAVEAIIDLPQSPDRDQAINGFISALAGQDPEAAVIWAGEINDPGLREAAMVRAGTRFFQSDEAAAQSWFEKSGLPDSARGKMGGGEE